jgi:threonine dehydrogenase-like Zn-dependent dehydrogenase
VVVVEPQPGRRRLATNWCDDVLDVEEFFDGDEPVDVVIEASGDLSNVARVMARVRARGRIILLGRAGEPLVVDDVDHLISHAITLRGSRGHLGGAMDEVMGLLADGTLPLGAMITGELDDLDSLRDALRDQTSIRDSHGKVVVRLGEPV